MLCFMTTNELLLTTLAQHMRIPADSGIGRLTRSHLFYALMDAGYGEVARKAGQSCEERARAFVALADRAREERLFAAQRAHKAALAQPYEHWNPNAVKV